MKDIQPMNVVLAYSGGLDTSVGVGWLTKHFGCHVHCVIVDVGQDEDLQTIKERALKNGAATAHIDDARETFVRDYVFPMLQGHPLYEGRYLLGSAISRPLIAQRLAFYADELKADAVAHGATGKGNDQFRFEWSLAALGCTLPVIAPWRIWSYRSRAELVEYAVQNDLSLEDYSTNEKPLSTDKNIVHTSYEGQLLEDPTVEILQSSFKRVHHLDEVPNEPDRIRITFASGMPVSIDDVIMSPAAILDHLNTIGSKHGVGRVDHVESRLIGMKSRNVYETPGLTILYDAHRTLEAMCLDREVIQFKESLMPQFARLIYDGLWFAPEMRMFMAAFNSVRENVNGTIELDVFKGHILIRKRIAQKSLYDVRLSSLEEDHTFRHENAAGYIHLGSIRLRAASC